MEQLLQRELQESEELQVLQVLQGLGEQVELVELEQGLVEQQLELLEQRRLQEWTRQQRTSCRR